MKRNRAMSKTTNAQKSNQYECLGRETGLDENIFSSSLDLVAGVEPTPMFASVSDDDDPEVITVGAAVQNKTNRTK